MKKSIPFVLLASFAFTGFATTTDEQLWFAFVHQGRVTKHWGYWAEVQHRTKNQFANNLHQDLFRVGATYYINKDLRITAGYAAILSFPSLTNQSFLRPEHRPWQQIFYTYTHKHKKLRIIQYIRSEQRLLHKVQGETLVDGYIFRERLRYSIMLVALFNKKEFKQGSAGVVLNNEVLINAYASDKVKTFDQNRAFAGACYNLTDNLQLHLGYLNIFQFTPKGNEVIHAIRLTAFHNISWVKA